MSDSITVVLTAMTDAEEKYVLQSISSVLCQSVSVSELHVYVELSNKWIDRIVRELPADCVGELRVYRTPMASLSSVRNTGVSNAKTKWIAFLDADDIWCRRKIEWQLEALAGRPDALFIGVDCLFVNDANKAFHIGRCVFPVPSSWIVRRDLLERIPFDPRKLVNEDQDWLIRAFAQGLFVRVARIGVRYRLRFDSLFSSLKKSKPKVRQVQEALAFASYFPLVRFITLMLSYARYRFYRGAEYRLRDFY